MVFHEQKQVLACAKKCDGAAPLWGTLRGTFVQSFYGRNRWLRVLQMRWSGAPPGRICMFKFNGIFHEQNQVLARATNVLGAGTAPLRGAFV